MSIVTTISKLLTSRCVKRFLSFNILALPLEWRKLHNEEMNDRHSSPNIFRVIKSRIMRSAEHVARMGRGEVYTGFRWGNLRERGLLGDQDVDGRLI